MKKYIILFAVMFAAYAVHAQSYASIDGKIVIIFGNDAPSSGQQQTLRIQLPYYAPTTMDFTGNRAYIHGKNTYIGSTIVAGFTVVSLYGKQNFMMKMDNAYATGKQYIIVGPPIKDDYGSELGCTFIGFE